MELQKTDTVKIKACGKSSGSSCGDEKGRSFNQSFARSGAQSCNPSSDEIATSKKERRAGVLLPIFSLPGEYGIGSIGKEAKRFVEFLASAGMRVWQILPLQPTGYGDSPYQSACSYALNYYFIDLDELKKDGCLTQEDLLSAREHGDFLPSYRGEDYERIDYERLFHRRVPLLKKAYLGFKKNATKGEKAAFSRFLNEGEYYDFALFAALKERFDYRPFSEWGDFSVYSEEKAEAFAKAHAEELEFWQFTQYVFLKQWKKLKAFALSRGVEIFGDMPIYVAGDSVEMWKYGKTLFQTDDTGAQTKKAGVPPDAFSADGQLWGNPVYRWTEMKKDGFRWWKERIKKAFELYDLVRIDHFRGFDRYYAVDRDATSAREGHWEDGPKEDLFCDLLDLNIVAEDLGVIDEGVLRLMKNTGYPGMRVLEFAFDGNDDNSNKPSNSPKNSVTYTGTHDNSPFVAYVSDLEEWERERFSLDFSAECQKAGFETHAETAEEYCADAVRLAFASPSFLCIVPMQDVLALGKGARINQPSLLSSENWSYRFSRESLYSEKAAERLFDLAKEYDRLAKD